MPDINTNLNTQQALVDTIVAECKLSISEATFLAGNMIKLGSTHFILSVREVNQGLSDTQQRHMNLIEQWFELIAESVPGLKAAHFDGDVRSSTIFVAFDSGVSNSFAGGKWRIPVQLPSAPSATLSRPLKQDIEHLLAAKAQHAGVDVLKHLGNHPHPVAQAIQDA